MRMEAIWDQPFVDFGADALYPLQRRTMRRVDGDCGQELKRLVRQFVPRHPGVYGMLDAAGQLIYVGKSKALRNRLVSYFLPNNEEDKSGRIVQSTTAIVWEEQPSEFAALLREQFLIRTFQPRFNVQGMPRRQLPIYICIGRPPAEQFYTTRRFDEKASVCIGPLTGASRAARAVEVLNRLYRLRDCNSSQSCAFADQMQLFDLELRPGCIRLEIDSCLGPCVSACSRTQYQQQVERAKQFLTACDPWGVQQAEAKVRQAAEQLHFEQASILREDFLAVRWLHRRLCDLERARKKFTFLYEVDPGREPYAAPRSPVLWYLIRHGCVEACVKRPGTATERRSLGRSLQQWLAGSANLPVPCLHRPETLPLVSSWFRNRPTELRHTFSPGQMPRPAARSAG
ncbi:MAG: ethanolamine utilization protein [Planctomycetota bacterium]|nr:MAG: ethanolamine utilization protein [Planctomycetota bacterium]